LSKGKHYQTVLSLKARRLEKARYLFVVYQQMGPDRSLEKLHDILTKMGLKIALNTLKRYSVEFEWQRQILAINAKEHEAHERDILRKVDEMNEADAQVARGFRAFVVAAINQVRERMRIDQQARQKGLPPGQTAPLFLDMSFDEMVSMAKTAQQIERLARGQATSRTEVWIQVVETIVQEFALIFMAVNKLASEEERRAEWIRLCDDMIQRYYSQTVRQGIQMLNNGKGG
jgi:hypothetical protein